MQPCWLSSTSKRCVKMPPKPPTSRHAHRAEAGQAVEVERRAPGVGRIGRGGDRERRRSAASPNAEARIDDAVLDVEAVALVDRRASRRSSAGCTMSGVGTKALRRPDRRSRSRSTRRSAGCIGARVPSRRLMAAGRERAADDLEPRDRGALDQRGAGRERRAGSARGTGPSSRTVRRRTAWHRAGRSPAGTPAAAPAARSAAARRPRGSSATARAAAKRRRRSRCPARATRSTRCTRLSWISMTTGCVAMSSPIERRLQRRCRRQRRRRAAGRRRRGGGERRA